MVQSPLICDARTSRMLCLWLKKRKQQSRSIRSSSADVVTAASSPESPRTTSLKKNKELHRRPPDVVFTLSDVTAQSTVNDVGRRLVTNIEVSSTDVTFGLKSTELSCKMPITFGLKFR